MKRTKSTAGKKLSANNLEYHVFRTFLRKPKKRLNARQIIKILGIKNSKSSVQEIINKLSKEKKIRHVKDEKFQLKNSLPIKTEKRTNVNYFEGFVDLTRSGAGYIIVEGLEQDIYVPPKRMGLAMHGDRVKVGVIKKSGPRKEGMISEILIHSTEQFIGNFQQFKGRGFVVPDNRMVPFDIIIHPDDQGEAQDGDKVLIRIKKWPEKSAHSPSGIVVRKLDPDNEHELTMQSILINQGFDLAFPPRVMAETEVLNRSISTDDLKQRRDFRQIPTFTIDPTTAKDFDDALSIRNLENGQVEIGIHIADVTHYVAPGTALDKEAFRRSTSVYLVDRVAPMLPEILSNELCSLRPNEDSLTFSAVFNFDEKKRIVSRWFGKSIIHSMRRFTYDEAQKIIESKKGDHADYLATLNEFAKHLRKKRFKKGSIAFESPEIQFELDANNHPVAITQKVRKDAHLLVEDFMLLANREVATFISKKLQPSIPFVYRVHDLPDEEKIAEYSYFLRELGFQFNYSSAQAIRKSFANLHQEAKENEVLAMAEPLAVRTMAKAIYTTENIGHFGLGFDDYTHFTSPIRRYADVLVHRILHQNLSGTFRANQKELERQCQHVSNQERKAQEAERESIKYKQVEFIADHIGEQFEGLVSGMIDQGIFVTLKENRIDGLVGFDKLDEVYEIADSRLKAVSKKKQ